MDYAWWQHRGIRHLWSHKQSLSLLLVTPWFSHLTISSYQQRSNLSMSTTSLRMIHLASPLVCMSMTSLMLMSTISLQMIHLANALISVPITSLVSISPTSMRMIHLVVGAWLRWKFSRLVWCFPCWRLESAVVVVKNEPEKTAQRAKTITVLWSHQSSSSQMSLVMQRWESVHEPQVRVYHCISAISLVFTNPSGCHSTAFHAIVLTQRGKITSCVYLYCCVCWYIDKFLIYTDSLPFADSESIRFSR